MEINLIIYIYFRLGYLDLENLETLWLILMDSKTSQVCLDIQFNLSNSSYKIIPTF